MSLLNLRFCVELAFDDGKDSVTFVVFDKEMTKLTKQEAVVLTLEEVLTFLPKTFRFALAFNWMLL